MKYNVNVSDKGSDFNSSYIVDVNINNMVGSENMDLDNDSDVIIDKSKENENKENKDNKKKHKVIGRLKIKNTSITTLIALVALIVSVWSLHVAVESLNVARESLDVTKESLDVARESLDTAKIGAWAGVESLGYIEFFYENGIETYSEYREVLKYEENSEEALQFWLEDISKVRIGCSSQYIKEVLGEPINTDEIEFYEEKYRKDYYINPYCTIICFYNQDSSLLGYMVIGNDSDFKVTNYRCDFELFSYTIKEANQYCIDNHIGPVMYCQYNTNGRLDCNDYFFQCNFEHSYGAKPCYYIGFGICDIGEIISFDDFTKAIYFMTRNENFKDFTNYKAYQEYYEKGKNDLIRDMPINTMFVMKEIPHMNEFLYSYVAGVYMGVSVDDFANYQDDYSGYINDYIERNREYGKKYINQSTEDDD